MSERNLTAAVLAEIEKSQVQLALLVEIIFDGGPLRLWTGLGPFIFQGNTYTGVGNLGGIDRIEESASDVRAAGVAFTLSGIPSEFLSLVLQEQFQGRPTRIWLQLFDINWAPIDNAIMLNAYRLDYPVIEEGGQTSTITVYAESILADLERPRVRRYTHEDQQIDYPGDMGLEFVATIQNKEVIWKAAMPSS
jgi:hypothetical protein